ncbi:nucleotidyltransferase family protein [Seohaeicola zhoushanensis]|uniref:Mannose-1-phosphate guanylyltransferase n=1 Tax=Seohaeicola zhoushanensis TaxID=1569283 RepID=A0A8J3H4A0_9RHOB|nr:nucleotidyltransferase family protein [Seohaeicola zhoushanensis]GHF75754.1 mannose-1-phosphate guanylyltransferase [Seohaeicola zhoushanensis]
MRRAKALLLAGGLGTRLKPLTDTMPKCLVRVAGRPILDYWMEALDRAGIGQALLNTHHHAEQVRAYIGAVNARGGVQLTEAHEPELLGSAGTVHANRGWAEDADEILVIYADNLSDIDLGALLAFHRGHSDPMTMALFRAEHPEKCGIAELDGAGRITSFVEKPEKPVSNLANAGLYVLDAAAWREIADMEAFDFGFDVIPRFVGRMRGFAHQGYHRDIGTPEALAAANADAPGLRAP